MSYTLSQLALILGTLQTDVWELVNSEQLPFTRNGKFVSVSEDDLVDFLKEHLECVGRIYCSDIPCAVNEIRSHLVSRLEENA